MNIKLIVYAVLIGALIGVLYKGVTAIYDAGFTASETLHTQANAASLLAQGALKEAAVAKALREYKASVVSDTVSVVELNRLRNAISMEKAKNADLLKKLDIPAQCTHVPVGFVGVLNDAIAGSKPDPPE